MGLDLLILFVLALAFWFLAGKLIDDVITAIDDQWSRGHAWEDLYGRRDERNGRGA